MAYGYLLFIHVHLHVNSSRLCAYFPPTHRHTPAPPPRRRTAHNTQPASAHTHAHQLTGPPPNNMRPTASIRPQWALKQQQTTRCSQQSYGHCFHLSQRALAGCRGCCARWFLQHQPRLCGSARAATMTARRSHSAAPPPSAVPRHGPQSLRGH